MSVADGSNPEPTRSSTFAHTSESLNDIITHVFLPVDLPRTAIGYGTLGSDLSLARAVCAAAHAYSTHVHGISQARWHHITRMLDNLQASAQSEYLDRGHVISQLRGMQIGDILALLIRHHNSAIILTKRENCTLVESFEVSPHRYAVEETAGSLICLYPRLSIEIPSKIFDDEDFQFQLAMSLWRFSIADSYYPPPPPADHAYDIIALCLGILQGTDHAADVPRIVKRVRDNVQLSYTDPWRRSPLWLLTRVTIQMSLDRYPLGRASYKAFMLFFISTIASDVNITTLSTNLLHLMASKILRRMGKIGSSIPDWLSQLALNACAGIRKILDARWMQLSPRSSPFQNPSQDELRRDTQLSLKHSREYIRNALANHGHESAYPPFHPSHHRRGTIDDFLSSNGSFFDDAYDVDPEITLYDVEQSIEQALDVWASCVVSEDEACAHLEILMDKYMAKAWSWYIGVPEAESIWLLTGTELFVVLDKLVVKKIPMLADYSPEIPTAFLEKLLLRRTTSLHRLSRTYQYLSARHSRSRPGWSVLSNEFTKDSFAVRYYDQSPHLQQLKARIEEDAMANYDGYEDSYPFTEGEISRSPLPALPLHAKVTVFELQCPTCVRIWRSAAARLLHYFCHTPFDEDGDASKGNVNPSHASVWKRYFAQGDGVPLNVQFDFLYFYLASPRSRDNPGLDYGLRYPEIFRAGMYVFKIWEPKEGDLPVLHGLSSQMYLTSSYTSHTSNGVLAAQADCPNDLSLDEFIAFGHLWTGGSLRWVNILQGLRSRTLNLRHRVIHYLLTTAAFEVGPLDLKTGTWIWHQDVCEPCFCNALLDELQTLFTDARASSIDGTMMSSISLLLTRMLALSPSEVVSERAISLLQSVRRKTFHWVQELSYNLAMAPTNKERSRFLLDMVIVCRSTFDVDSATLPKLFRSAEDVDAALSCALLALALRPQDNQRTNRYLRLLLERDRRLSHALEKVLGDVILTDPSNYTIDLAVGKIFPSHKPGVTRWEPLPHPNTRWLTCRTESTANQVSQVVHLDILATELRVNGQRSGGLPRAIRDDQEYEQIFRDQGFFVVPSNLPGMDFTTLTAMSKHKVHFSLRGDGPVIRVQFNQSKDVLQLIPSSKLKEDLPPALVDGHIHWLNLSTKIIEIRPRERLWEESSDNWRIDCASGQYRAYKGREILVDMGSPTWVMLWKCFECLNVVERGSSTSIHNSRSNNLLITTSSVDYLHSAPVLQLSATLPHYGLSFFVNERGELESRDFKDMVYDEDQSVGTLYDLENILVLRQNIHLPAELVPRHVLIPNGFPEMDFNHRIRVSSTSGYCNNRMAPGEPLYYTYNVDTELGCLVGSGSLWSTQHLIQLHALTSQCDRLDQLTGKTGAQAAYFLLQSAGCRSIMKLKVLDVGGGRTKTPYVQIKALFDEIRKTYYWVHSESDGEAATTPEERRRAQRAAYLFPWCSSGLTSPEDRVYHGKKYVPTPAPAELSTLLRANSYQGMKPITLDRLFSKRAPRLPSRSILLHDSDSISSESYSPNLSGLFASLATNKYSSSFQQEYLTHLDSSAQHISANSWTIHGLKDLIDGVKRHYTECRVNYLAALEILKESLGPTADPYEQALSRFGQWPPIMADNLLRCLASTSSIKLPGEWKKCLVSFALLLLDLQRARRLLRYALDGLEEELSKELENEGCEGWDPEDYPDWLLIQIQGNFLIRRAQAEVAMEMMLPKAGRNTVMQVNMGEGKSSVIIPIVAAALADGEQLVRVIVPKALVGQMFDLLVARLGRLANRPIYHLPFTRSPEHDDKGKVISLQVDDLHKIMSRCMAERGVLLVQPEHVVSLKLMSVQEQIREEKPAAATLLPKLQTIMYKHITTALSLKSLPEDSIVSQWFGQLLNNSRQTNAARAEHRDEYGDNSHSTSDTASKWLRLQQWMYSHVRDILDESDEILHPRFQLSYTIGLEQHMDGYPDRWRIIQQVLRLVGQYIPTLSKNHAESIEYQPGPPGSFPHIRFLRACDVGLRLVSLIAKDVVAGRLPSFSFQGVSTELQDAIRSFISDNNILQVPDTAKRVEEYARSSDRGYMWSGLLVLRGLLASKILLFALTQRRWRVDYGLASQSRNSNHSPIPTMLAVPYLAKDIPSPNTQFSHPDIIIILTCLSYHYSGLTGEQLRSCLQILLDDDDPSVEYALWIKNYDAKLLPDSLRTLGEINLRSSEQWDNIIFPLFSRNQGAIDFYLSRVVFPKEAKEFPWKLSASSWDLAEERDKVITGFSGTNDGRWLLPMSTTQHDLDDQHGSNARVLGYLLRPENDFYMAIHQNSKQETTRELLSTVTMQKPEICALLDVGAQILDLSNVQVAKAWLDVNSGAAGAIYFNEEDELMVLMRNGASVPMASSPLSQRLDRCVVYLDHAHTRGTDIKLPVGSRAAVTLGAKVTKDRLVQGCMRMRKLGHGHSVMFFAPPEVDLSIRAVTGKHDPNTRISTVDVLCWAIHETWADIQQRAPYWAQQGMDYKSRSDAWSRFCNNELTSKLLSDAWLQSERKSLEDLYGPYEAKSASATLSALDPGIRQRCKDLCVLSFPSAELEGEQEREANRQQEREREVELPPEADPAEHFLHQDVVAFVKTGVIPPLHPGNAFRPVFTTLEKSSATTREADVWSPSILATTDFCNTIKPGSTKGTIDQYLRPVQWVLSSERDGGPVLVLISPFEADRLMPDIRTSYYVHLHVYAPRTSQSMKPSDDLKLYSIPPLPSDWTPPWALIDQLNVFAGQLYLRDYPSYLRLCQFLGVPTKELPNDGAVRRNLFHIPGSFEEDEITFSASPLPSVMALLGIRNRGRPFAHTHMGRILQGQLLTKKDFEAPGPVGSPRS